MSSGARLEKLTIENFGGIKHLEMDVSPFTVLIGPQSVGKSITAKVLYFFKSLPWSLFAAASRDQVTNCEDAILRQLRYLFSPETFGEGGPTLIWSGTPQSTLQIFGPTVSVPNSLRNAYEKFTRAKPELEFSQVEGEEIQLSRSKFRSEQEYWHSIDEIFPNRRHDAYFVPAGRSFYAQIEKDAASFYMSAQIDPFVSEFGKLLARLKHRNGRIHAEANPGSAAEMVKKLLGGSYKRENNEDFIVSTDGRRLRSVAWSSGQQEAHPLAIMLQHLSSGVFAPGHIFIEEPEAHLFPTSQQVMTELIALAFKARSPDTSVFLTTHSPYILTTMNNLLQAGLLYSETRSDEKRKKLSEIVSEDRALAPDSVGVFFMDQDSCRSIMDEETGLIGTSEIDQASWDLSEQFDALLETQPA